MQRPHIQFIHFLLLLTPLETTHAKSKNEPPSKFELTNLPIKNQPPNRDTDPGAVFDPQVRLPAKGDIKILWEMKQAELQHRYRDCAHLGLTGQLSTKSLAGWIAWQSLDCLVQDRSRSGQNGQRTPNSKKNSPPKTGGEAISLKIAKDWLKTLSQSNTIFTNTASRPFLLQILPKFIASFALQIQSKDRWSFIDLALRQKDLLSPQEKTRLLSEIGSWARENKLPEAEKYFSESSLGTTRNESSNGNQNENEGSLSESNRSIENNGLPEILKWLRGDSTLSTELQEAQDFQKWTSLEVSAKSTADANYIQNFVQTGVDYLNKYPGGKQSSQIADRILRTYQENISQGPLILKLMVKAPSKRVIEWIKSLHRRLEFVGAFELYQALPEESKWNDPDAGSLVYMGARCAEFVGKFKEAVEGFEWLVKNHSGHPEIVEIYHRLGVISLLSKNTEKALQYFSRVLGLPNNKNYELSALYWSYRILGFENFKSSTISDPLSLQKEILAQIEKKYALSYYGFLLAAEKNEGRLFYGTNTDPTGAVPFTKTMKENTRGAGSEKNRSPFLSIWVTPEEKEILKRAEILSTAGWWPQSQAELELLTLPRTPELKVLTAFKMAELRNYPLVIRLLNQASSENPNYQDLQFARIGFPKLFRKWIEAEAKKYKLDPILILSLMRQESAFSLRALSTSQAQGLMQMIPATAKEVASELKLNSFSPTDIFEPSTNISFGTYYIAKMIKQFSGNIPLGLAAYNAGPHRLKKFLEGREDLQNYGALSNGDFLTDLWIEELPWLETNIYVKSILRNALIYTLLDSKIIDMKVKRPLWSSYLGNSGNY